MAPSTRMVWLGYAGIVLTIVWGVGIVPALLALRLAKSVVVTADSPARIRRDYRGGVLLARLAMATNGIALAFIAWILLSTYVL